MHTMAKTDSIADFAMKFTLIISELRNLGEEMDEKDVVWRFLRATPSKFDALTLSLEKYADLDKVNLDEIIGSFTVHELRLKERESREEEQTLLAKALNKTKLTSEEESSSRGRGHHRGRGRGRGRGRHLGNEEEKEKKTFDKSSIQCYNSQKDGHFAYEYRNLKREREDRAYVANSAPTLVQTPQAPPPAAKSSLLMAIEEARSDFLLQGSEIDHHPSDLWYLDTGATNHMTGQRNFFTTLDELADGFVKFGDNSRVEIKGRGSVVVLRQDGQRLSFGNVLFVPNLCANILSLGRLDEEGCMMTMFGGRLSIHDRDCALLAEVHRTEGRLYLLKLKVEDNCLLTKADDNSSRLWHLRYGHLNYHFLKKMATKKLVEGLPLITLPTQLCHNCLA